MLALIDSALARLCIGATRVRRGRRRQWLQEIAARIDPPRAIIRSRERLLKMNDRFVERVERAIANGDERRPAEQEPCSR